MKAEIDKALELRTARLVLRPVGRGDEARLCELCDDEELARNSARIPRPYRPADAERFARSAAAAFARGDEHAFSVLENDEMIACAGVMRRPEEGERVFELGYWVGAPYRGRGVASEAAACVLAFARDRLGARAVTAGHFADNPASGAVLRKIGLSFTGERAKLFSLGRGCEAEALRYRIDF